MRVTTGFGGTVRFGARSVLGSALLAGFVAGWAASGAAQTQPPDASAADTDTVRQIERLVARDSTNFDNLYRLGVAYMDRDRALEAVGIFERATTLRPEAIRAWVNLGAARDAIGHGADARRAYRKALELRAEDEIALCRLAASLYANGFKAEAMDTLRLALAKHPRSYCAHFTLGVAFADAQIFKEAIRAWEKVIEYGPDTPEALSARESIATLRELMGPNAPAPSHGHSH